MKRISVKSSNIKSVGYDADTKIMEVEFSNSVIYQYADVSEKTHKSLMDAKSKGSYFHRSIRPTFKYCKVVDDKPTELRAPGEKVIVAHRVVKV